MARENLAPETPPNKGMSSRLLTMKFMQRAAHSESANSTPASKGSSSSKRRKTDSPLTGEFHSFDEAAIQAALKQQEATRQAALAKHTAESADTHWVLDGFADADKLAPKEPQRNIEYVGFAQIDGTASDDLKQQTKYGRQKVGNYKSKEDKASDKDDSDSSDEDGSDSDSGDDRRSSKNKTPTGKAKSSLRRQNSGSKQSAEAMKARELRDKRKKPVNLNQLSSISGGISGGGGSSRSDNFNCHACGKSGHKAMNCPQKGKRGGGGGGKRKSMD